MNSPDRVGPFLTKTAGNKIRRIHTAVGNRPVCGGGNGGKSTQWQEDMAGPCNCDAYRAIENRARLKLSSSPNPPPKIFNN